MDKFQKRVKKLAKHPQNCVVVGKGFGRIKEIAEVFKTVFVFDVIRPEVKLKNLVYRENANDFNNLTDITAVFYDLETLDQLENTTSLFDRCKSLVVIEGNDPIGRHLSGPLYQKGYQCINLFGFFHVWELKK